MPDPEEDHRPIDPKSPRSNRYNQTNFRSVPALIITVNSNLGHLVALAYAQAYAKCAPAMSLERHGLEPRSPHDH